MPVNEVKGELGSFVFVERVVKVKLPRHQDQYLRNPVLTDWINFYLIVIFMYVYLHNSEK